MLDWSADQRYHASTGLAHSGSVEQDYNESHIFLKLTSYGIKSCEKSTLFSYRVG